MTICNRFAANSVYFRILLKTSVVVFFVFEIIIAGDASESILLNQLYSEIMGSSTNRTISIDSVMPTTPPGNAAPGHQQDASTDPSSDRLQQEIEKMMQDVRIRHSDAVKFMQDNNNR